MVRTGDNLATGFLGPVKGWGGLVPSARSARILPEQLDLWRSDAAAGEALDLVEVRALTESMGRVEDAFADFAARLRSEGTLLVDVDNLQSARMLRMVVEGRPGAFDPSGSPQDPNQALPLRRVLAAAAANGLLVRDVLRVPSGAQEFGCDLAPRLFGAGMMPLDWLTGTPPSRFWLHCEKVTSLAGSVVIAGGSAADKAATESALRSFLPEDWEVVTSDAIGEAAQWNRGIAAARGDVLWLLRGGTAPSEQAFSAMAPRGAIGPVAPTSGSAPTCVGDVSGMMLPRLDVLFCGPIPEATANTQVALEDYAMLLESKLPAAFGVEASMPSPPPPVEHPESFEQDTEALVERWSALSSTEVAQPAAPATAQGVRTLQSPPWAGRAPKITLCMIARDEERFLGECLERARGAYDELVVVDTGSVDRTVEIAESYGARVLHAPWQDDFSAPRNLALQAATGDWVLVLDADEFVLDGGCERIRELVQDPTALGFHMRFTNLYTGGKTIGVMMVRLFRNLPGIAYENVIHEQVTPSLQAIGGPMELSLRSSEVEVEHHGYTEQLMADRSKNERNERLFQKQLASRPDDIYGLYKYGDFLRRVPGRSEDARRLLDRCFDLIVEASPADVRALPYAGEVAALCALEAERAGDRARSQLVVDVALRRFVPTPNLHYLAAGLALADGDSEVAITHYRRCLAYRDRVLVVPIQEGITSYVSLAGIAQAWSQRGERERARRLLEQAIAIEPSYEVAHLHLSRLFLEAGDVTRALGVLTSFLAEHPDSPGACQQTMLLLHQLGRDDAAAQMGEQTVRLLEARCLEREAAEVKRLLAGFQPAATPPERR